MINRNALSLSDTQVNALRYWSDTDSAFCYRGGNRATLASLIRRGLLESPRGLGGHRITAEGRAALARFA